MACCIKSKEMLHSFSNLPSNQCGHFSRLIKSFVWANLTSNSILSPEFSGFDDKLGTLDFSDPNQCGTQKKAQCPVVKQEHNYLEAETPEHTNTAVKVLYHIQRIVSMLHKIAKSHRTQVQTALVI